MGAIGIRQPVNLVDGNSKAFQFVQYDKRRLFQKRKYVKRSKPQPSDKTSDSHYEQSEKLDTYGGTIEMCRRILASGLQPLSAWTQNLEDPSSKALLIMGSRGPVCPFVQKWLPMSLHDDQLRDCFLLFAGVIQKVGCTFEPSINNDPTILQFKIRAIRATNAILQDEERNTSDTALVAVGILAFFERKQGNEAVLKQHAQGLNAILKRRRERGETWNDICPLARKGVTEALTMNELLLNFEDGSLPQADDATSAALCSYHLRNRLHASMYSVTISAPDLKAESSASFIEIMRKLDQMLGACENLACSGVPQSEFAGCLELLDDLFHSSKIFRMHIGPEATTEGVSRSSWVGAVGTLLWIAHVGLQRPAPDLTLLKLKMTKWLSHDTVRILRDPTYLRVREWAEYACRLSFSVI